VPGIELIFLTPSWPRLLTVAAGAALLWEAMGLVRALYRQNSPLVAGAISLGALAAGPVMLVIASLYGALTTGEDQPFRGKRVVEASGRGTLLLILGAWTLFASEMPSWLPDGRLVALGVCALAWARRAYSPATSSLAPSPRRRLLRLRSIGILLLLLWALHPTLVLHQSQQVRAAVLLGLDASASMNHRDIESGGRLLSRAEAACEALEGAEGSLRRIARQGDLRVFRFDDSARMLPAKALAGRPGQWLGSDPKGRRTAIGDAVSQACDPLLASGAKIGAIVLITDGCSNTSQTVAPHRLADLMGSRRVPVFTAGAGAFEATGPPRSLRVLAPRLPDEVQAFRRFGIFAGIEATGLAGRRVEVAFGLDGEVIDQRVVRVATDRYEGEVAFEHVPTEVGFHRLDVSVRCLEDGEPIPEVSTSGRLVHVVDRETRVLYLEGRPRYEAKYVARAIQGAPGIRVDKRVLGEGSDSTPGEHLEDWLPYHAILLGDLPASRLTPRQHEILRELVGTWGKGVCMLGGRGSFADGGWGETPLADVLGVDVAASMGQIDAEIRVVPTATGLTHEAMRIASRGADQAQRWVGLPPLPGANALGPPKPAGELLATSADNRPLVVALRYGKGRTLAIAFDTTWRWVLTPQDTAGAQERFWRQVVVYLAQPRGNVWVNTDRARYEHDRLEGGSESIRIEAGVEDATGRPITAPAPELTLRSADGEERALALEARGTSFVATPGPLEPGVYALELSANVEGTPISDEHRFEVIRREVESQDTIADFGLLRRMAAAGGGTFLPVSRLGELLEQVHVAGAPRTRITTREEAVSDALRWPILLMALGALCAEWALRKRQGLA
jgi:Putative glutamine amidotransferase